MSVKFKLPILGGWRETLQSWAAAIRPVKFLLETDFAWKPWEPAISTSGGGSVTGISTKYAQYLKVNDTVFLSVACSITVSSSPTIITMDVPLRVAPEATPFVGVYPLSGFLNISSTYYPLSARLVSNSTDLIYLQRSGAAAFANGEIGLTGFYKSA